MGFFQHLLSSSSHHPQQDQPLQQKINKQSSCFTTTAATTTTTPPSTTALSKETTMLSSNNNNNNQQQPSLSPTAAGSSSSSPTDQQQHHHHHHFFHMHTTNERFRILEDGTHEHHLSGPAQNRLTSSINDFVDGLFHRESARSLRLWGGDRRMSPEELQEERDAIDASLNRTTTPETCLAQKWGVTQEVIGKGAFGKIRIIRREVQQPSSPSSSSSAGGDGDQQQQLFAVKEFRRKGSETLKSYVRRLVSEYDISSALQHRHIVATFDLLPLTETSSTYCLVMEYCEGGDLFELIFESSDGLATAEANCFFKQLLQGVAFLHSVGIAHRDIKPENLLLTPHGCLKISDFGSSVYIGGGARGDQEDDEDAMHYCKGIVGSEPYIAPEQFVQSSYDGRRADVWSCAVVYVAMATGSHLWHVARQGEDDDYDRFLRFRQLLDSERQRVKQMHSNNHLDPAEIQRAREVIRRRAREDGCDMLTGLEFGAKKLVYRMLDPSPCKRPCIAQILNSPWASNVWSCQPAHST